MTSFETQWTIFWTKFGDYKKMILSTSLNQKVTSRMMSIVQKNGVLYFQTDKTSRKYRQLIENENVALCIDNIQIEGVCKEIGHPLDHAIFSKLYKKHFSDSFDHYSMLKNEILFEVTPLFVKSWIYQDGVPFEEVFDFQLQSYSMLEYKGE